MPAKGTTQERIIRPAAVVPERVARLMLAWLEEHDVTRGGAWAHDVSYIKRFSGPFDGPSGMRGSAVLLDAAPDPFWKASIPAPRRE